MNIQIEPLQQLVLWRLAVSDGGGEFLKNIEAKLPAAKRKALVREGLVEETKQKAPDTGRGASFLELTDKGWAWCQNHLTDDLKTRSLMSTPILQRLLCLLHDFFQHQDDTVSLAQFIHQARPPRASESKEPMEEARDDPSPAGGSDAPDANEVGHAKVTEPAPEPPPEETTLGESSPTAGEDPLERLIAAACREITAGRENVRVRLSELRGRVRDVDRDALDRKLLAMERDGKLSLYSLDNPQEIEADDRDAAVRTPAGSVRHIVYFGGRGS